MFGALPASIFLDIARSTGAYFQLPLFETPPKYVIKEEHCTSVYAGWRAEYTEHGVENCSSTTYVDHPAFTALREHLGSKGFIEIQRGWSNGDRVKKEFFLNDKFFEVGDTFYCAAAMHYGLFKEKQSTDIEEHADFFFNTPTVNEDQEKRSHCDEW